MERVFQHYEGVIHTLKGASFVSVKTLRDNADDNVVLLWVCDVVSHSWYRIFIDGAYCGVDRYERDESWQDFDDDLYYVDHSAWFYGKILDRAEVLSPAKAGEYIVLSMNFSDDECRLVCESEDGECAMQFNGSVNV